MGPPGSGKGTQGDKLAEELSLTHIAVGDLLRSEVEAATDLGRAVAAPMERGELISDDLIAELIGPYVLAAASNGGYILDGFPRTLTQAVAARQVANDLNVDADVVVWLEVPPTELIRRLVGRSQEERRSDDAIEIVKRRLQVYEDATRPLLDYYHGRGLLVGVEASGDPDTVTKHILEALRHRPRR
jgi:adenylate kinase